MTDRRTPRSPAGGARAAFNAASGGAIANVETSLAGTSASGVLTMTGTDLRGNAALLGGGLYNGGTANVTGGLIESSAATPARVSTTAPIVWPTADPPPPTSTARRFNNNVASGLTLANFGNGGAIFNTEKLTVRNATFTGNKAVASTVRRVRPPAGAARSGTAPSLANDAPDLTISDTDIAGGGVSATP